MGISFQLKLLSGPNPNQVYPLVGSELIIGRDPSCNLLVNDPEVSRRHARMTLQPSGFVIEDLGSTNGTFINGQRINMVTPLQSGDRLSLGDNITLLFESLPEEAVISAASQVIPSATTPLQSSLTPPSAPTSSPLTSFPREIKNGKRERAQKGKSRLITILLILVLIFLCAVAAYFIVMFLYEAPPSFWCKALPFIFKPELYPQCLP